MIFRDLKKANDPNRCGEIDEEIKMLCRALENVKSLKSFSIFIGEISSKALKYLRTSLKKLPRLQKLCINFYRNWIPSEGLQDLSTSLKKFISLKSLAFEFSECEGIGEIARKSIYEGFEKLTKLQRIKLQFDEHLYDGCLLRENELRKISQALKRLINLQEISLSLSVDGEAQDYWLDLLGERLKSFIHLKKFRLSLSYCEISDEGLQSICEGLRNLPSIACLCFEFTRCGGLTDDGLLIISEAFQNRCTLEYIQVSLKHWLRPITEGLKRFEESLKNFVSYPKFVVSE